jgi:hypothetical protein
LKEGVESAAASIKRKKKHSERNVVNFFLSLTMMIRWKGQGEATRLLREGI